MAAPALAGDGLMIHIGSSYYLLQTPEADWERDFAQMAAAGHTMIRTGELISTWEMIEPAPGAYDFASLDRAFELCAKHKLKLLLGTGACSPPLWLAKEHADVCIVDRDANPYPPGAMWSWACINHPAYLEACDAYLAKLLERYGERPELIGWQIHNEPGFPFMPRAERDLPDWYDYNEHTLAAFRAWLKERYGTIDSLNEAWRWIPTSGRQLDFATIDAPRRTPSEWGAPRAWLDWRSFTYANWNAFISRQHRQIKARTPAVPTMTNMYGAAYDRHGRLGADSWTLPAQVDAIGYDIYPGPHMGANPGFVSWYLDFAASTARLSQRPLWLPELEAGPLGGWAAGPAFPTAAAHIRRWGLQALSRGAQMLLYQGYRDWRNLPLTWTGLAGWEGEPTERLAATGELASFVREQGEDLAAARSEPAQLGIMHDQLNTVFCAGTSVGAQAHASLEDFHRGLNHAGYSVQFISPAHAAAFADCAAIILPFTVMLASDCAAALAAYVERGGTLITFARTGMVDQACRVYPARPGGLAAVLGVTELATQAVEEVAVGWDDGDGREFAGSFQQQELGLAEDVAVLARFAPGGAPALTQRAVGAGSACHFATHLAGDQVAAALPGLLARLGIAPALARSGDCALDARLLEVDPARRLLFVANEGAGALATKLSCAGIKISAIERLWPCGDCELVDAATIALRLPADGASVLRLRLA